MKRVFRRAPSVLTPLVAVSGIALVTAATSAHAATTLAGDPAVDHAAAGRTAMVGGRQHVTLAAAPHTPADGAR